MSSLRQASSSRNEANGQHKRSVLGDVTNAIPGDRGDAHKRIRGDASSRGTLVDVGDGLFDRDANVDRRGRATWMDIDAPHVNDPQMCTLYVNDIYRHLRDAELEKRPSSDYMETTQKDINSTMRGILVDWLVEVAEEYKLNPDTLFLSVLYIDRCLSVQTVARTQLQLVGVTCMLIASKYEEIYAPQVDEFCYITDNTYTRQDVLSMERTVLDALGFELTQPTIRTFLQRCLKAAQCDGKVEFMAMFLAELALLEYSFLKFSQSTIAAAAVSLSLVTLGKASWSSTLEHYTALGRGDLRECVEALHQSHLATQKSSLSAVREKYSQVKFKSVALIKAPRTLYD